MQLVALGPGSDRSKHINIRCFFLRDAMANGVDTLKPNACVDNLADLLTKLLPAPRTKAAAGLNSVLLPLRPQGVLKPVIQTLAVPDCFL